MSGVERIAQAFANCGKHAALMPYLMAGFPTLDDSRAIGEACIDAGADLLEIGVPYADPLADGPVIHAAGTRALQAGVTLDGALQVARALAPRAPLALMCYANMVFARGAEDFVARLADTGACGLIVPDLPYEEADVVSEQCERAGIALIPLIAPTTTPERLRAIGSRARGFVYAVSVVGTTGERASVHAHLKDILTRAKENTEVPVAVGFGISTPQHARAAADAGADGVIVGTRLVRAAGESDDPAGAVGELVRELAAGLALSR